MMNFDRHSLRATAFLTMATAGALTAQAADVAQPAKDIWTGIYLGAQAGYLQGSSSNTDICVKTDGGGSECLADANDLNLGDNNAQGVSLGGYLGYNYRIQSFVLGLEGDLDWDSAKETTNVVSDLGYTTHLNWDAAIRARLGFIVDERALLYVTGGPGWIGTTMDHNLFCTNDPNVDCGESRTEFGWQIGGGGEYALSDQFSIKAEYLHGWYGDANLAMARDNSGASTEKIYLKQNLQTNVVRAGIAYRFSGF